MTAKRKKRTSNAKIDEALNAAEERFGVVKDRRESLRRAVMPMIDEFEARRKGSQLPDRTSDWGEADDIKRGNPPYQRSKRDGRYFSKLSPYWRGESDG